MARPIAVLGAAVAVVAVSACSAIIGAKDIFLVDDAGTGEGGGGDGSAQPDSPVNPGDTGGDNTTCGDTTSDGKNCGRCGHDCLGGQCTAGECQPVAIAQGQPGPYAIAVDDKYVFWADSFANLVMRLNKDDGGALLSLTPGADSGVDNPIALLLDDTQIFWTNYSSPEPLGKIQRCAKTGCAGTQTTLYLAGANDAGAPYGLAMDDAGFYFTESTNHIGHITRAGTGYADLGSGIELNHLVTDGTSLFVTDSRDSKIYKCPLSGCGATPTTLASNQGKAYAIALDATDVYWTSLDDTAGVVARIAKNATGGTQPSVLAASMVNPVSIALDDSSAYWVSSGKVNVPAGQEYTDGAVLTCPKTGCPAGGPKVLAKNLHDPRGIAVDKVAIYWTVHGVSPSGNEGAVMRLAK